MLNLHPHIIKSLQCCTTTKLSFIVNISMLHFINPNKVFSMLRFLLLLLCVFPLGVAYKAYSEPAAPYPASVVNLFNRDCGKDAYMMKVCSCTINEVQRTVPLAQFLDEGSKAGGIASDPRYMAAIKGCVAKYPQSSSYVPPK